MMKLAQPTSQQCANTDRLLAAIPEEITEEDRALFFHAVSVDLSDWQKKQIVSPDAIFKRQESILACHWHPEFIPMDLCRQRIEAMFPNADERLIIPTQHNELLQYGDYSGVEVDCYSSGFNQKVQLLLHFHNDRLNEAHTLKSMLSHTFKYRSSQFFEFLRSFTGPNQERLEKAARATGANQQLVSFATLLAGKVESMLNDNWADVPPSSIKNKLLRDFVDGMRPLLGDLFIDHAQAFIKAVKEAVKNDFPLDYFYRASEIIEETRNLGGGIVIPHPEQFWPILLRGYDVDGYEVWNPQSQRYTDFLIEVVNQHNKNRGSSQRELLIFMGDDCHLGEKTRPLDQQDKEKASREVGLQPAWDDLNIRKKLVFGAVDRASVIRCYKERLATL
ncbi:hypothetical protein [Desulfovibrio mangrovi]|uniref:hypothetical protein n=1 Tax=Desulfovibrio mangrovi TaxID=2976983 RepID=UPI003084695C